MRHRFAFAGFRHPHVMDMYRRCLDHDKIEVLACCEADPATRSALANGDDVAITHDDYKTMLRIIRNLLAELGFKNVDEATDGSAALETLRAKKYDLVISDWNVEPMTGLDLLREVRADEQLKPMPFIMVTAESKTENVVAAKKAGVNNYIVKPFNAATLRSKVAAVIGEF